MTAPPPESPFSARALLALLLLGAGIFAALLWMIGAGMTAANINNGGGHAGARGLNGYAAFARLLEQHGMPVSLTRSAARLDDPGLLVLTPPPGFSGEELELIVGARRRIGPKLIIAPKWLGSPTDGKAWGAKPGWVELQGTSAPDFNRDRLRAGDLIAGSWVVEAPRPLLAPAISAGDVARGERSHATGTAYRFGEAELAAYGEYELQVLEGVLRDAKPDAMAAVARTICGKIGWEPGVGDDRAFLEAYYTQLRARLEMNMRFGKRKANKFG